MKRIAWGYGAVSAVLCVAVMAVPQAALAASCTVEPTGKQNTAEGSQRRFTVKGTTVTVSFEVKGGKDCRQEVTLATWQAPGSGNGQPYKSQKLYKHAGGTYKPGKHELSATLPQCHYQVDLVRGLDPAGANGTANYQAGRMLATLHGGETECESQASATSTMPATGPTANLGALFGIASLAGGFVHHVLTRQKRSRSVLRS